MKFKELKNVVDFNQPNIIWERVNDEKSWCYGVLMMNIGNLGNISEFDEREVEKISSTKSLESVVTNVILTQVGENRYFKDENKKVNAFLKSEMAK